MSIKSFKLIINAGSGHDKKDQSLPLIVEPLRSAGHHIDIVQIEKSDNFIEIVKKTVLAAKVDGSIIVAAGGDGSINAIAGLCYFNQVPMGIIPMGTFNFFARDLGIPVDITEATKILMEADVQHTPVGMVNDQIFLVHAGIGLYSEIMRNREKDKGRFGRYRIVAFASSFLSLMSVKKTHTVTIETDGEKITRQTLNIFVGNNTLQLEKLGLTTPGEIDPDELAIIILKPTTPIQRLRLAFLGLIRKMKLDSRIERFTAKSFTIETKEKKVTAAIDGERVKLVSPLRFVSLPSGLQVIVPRVKVSS